jgi:hypothetical protein
MCRHCVCVYYQDWHRTRRPKPALEGNILPGVARSVTPQPSTGLPQLDTTNPRNTLTSSSGIIVAVGESSASSAPLLATKPSPVSTTGLSFDEEAKLVYGVVLSLRNMVKKLAGKSVPGTWQMTITYGPLGTKDSQITEHRRINYISSRP